MLMLSVVWNPSPEIFEIGGFAVRWYGLFFALSFFFGYLIMQKFFTREDVPIKLLDELTTYMIIGTIVGGAFGTCFLLRTGVVPGTSPEDFQGMGRRVGQPWSRYWHHHFNTHILLCKEEAIPLGDGQDCDCRCTCRIFDPHGEPDELRDLRVAYIPAMGVPVPALDHAI